MNQKKLSIVVPCYNEEESIPYFYKALEEVKLETDYDFEYVFVNDGSKDNTLEVIKQLASEDPEHVKYVSFSRNFGKEAGIYAGLVETTGELVTLMDVDLQDPPAILPEMIHLIVDEGYDIVGTRRKDREGEPPIRSFFANMFYKLINKISDTEMVNGARDYRLMTRQVVDSVLELSEVNRFSKGLLSWVGFKTTYLEFDNIEREHGNTSWNFWSLFSYSLEGIINFSNYPLKLSTYFGLLSFVGAIIGMIYVGIRALLFGDPAQGWPSLVMIILLIGGIQLLSIGVLGSYLSRVYLETKHRPVYIVREKETAKGEIDPKKLLNQSVEVQKDEE
jgi:glycosyltransferase involved in cell wall biosynthesis